MVSKTEIANYLGVDIDSEIEIIDGGTIILNDEMKKEREYWQDKIDEPNLLLKSNLNDVLEQLVKDGYLYKIGD